MKADLQLKKYLDLMPAQFESFVVGGAALDYGKATDVDIVILRPEDGDATPVIEALAEITGFEPCDEYGNQYLDGFSRYLAGKLDHNQTGLERNIQVMIGMVGETRIEQVLNQFDITTHMWAVDRQGRFHKGATATLPVETPRVMRWTSISTVDRYKKICQRYGVQGDLGDIHRLMEMKKTWCQKDGQRRVTAEEYQKSKPKAQGYISYMQGAWNKDVPDKCPYKEGTKEKEEWDKGQMQAVLVVQDSEE